MSFPHWHSNTRAERSPRAKLGRFAAHYGLNSSSYVRKVPRADVRHAGGAPSGQACSVKVALCGARFFLDGDGAHDFEDALTLHPLGLETRRLTDMPEEILSLPGAAHKGHRP